jgi:hypothetical protein
MQKFLKLFIGSYVLLLNAAYAQQNMVYPADVLNLPLNQIQFKATHNSYWLHHSPSRLIDDYNVWEIELDFGALSPSELVVGHDGPEGKFYWYLRDYVKDIKAANSLQYHPIILKLEAKISTWGNVNEWGDWQATLRNELWQTIGPDNWITKTRFKTEYNSKWRSARELKRKFIITLQDDDDDKYIQDPDSLFFIRDVPQLMRWPLPSAEFSPIKNATEFGRALKANVNRLIMDDGYREPWSNVLMHPPLPSWVDPLRTQAEGQWGTILDPFQTIGHAINASWTRDGEPISQVITLFAGNYNEKVTISTPVEFSTRNGPVTIGGKNVAYTIILSSVDEHEAGTKSPINVSLHGDKGSTGDYTLENPKDHLGREVYLDRAGAETFWITAADVGVLQSITIGVQAMTHEN